SENSDITQQHAQNTEHVLAQGKEADLDLNSVPESRKKEITDSLNSQGQIIHTGKVGIDRHETELQKAEQNSKEKSLIRAIAGNVVKNVVKKGSPLASVLLPND